MTLICDCASSVNSYQYLIDLMKCIQCMTSCIEKVEMYNRLSKQFGELSTYKESEKYKMECIKLAQKIKAYDSAIKVYKKLGDFKDSEERMVSN